LYSFLPSGKETRLSSRILGFGERKSENVPSFQFYRVGGVGAPPSVIRFYSMSSVGVDEVTGDGKTVRLSRNIKVPCKKRETDRESFINE